MKLIVATFVIVLLAFGCGKDNASPNSAETSAALKTIPASFSGQTTDFAFDFWQRVNTQESSQNNYFVSPLSLHIALGMLLNGADSKTKDEIQQTLRLSGDISQVNQIYKTLIENLPNADPAVTNKIANSVWYRNNFQVQQAFLDNLTQNFKATVSAEDFNSPATVSKINKWASDNTNGKIPQVINQISADLMLFLMNALYFKGDWTHPFDEKNTYDSPFNGISGQKTVKMMNMTQSIKYAKRGNYQAIELPYTNGNYVMTVLLPDDGKLTDFFKSLSSNEWQQLNNALSEQKIVIGLPKFTMQYEINLNGILQQMGMPTAFTDGADLSKIAPPAGKLKVGFVKQNTFVAVDEKGTEAAAVTTIGVTTTSLPNYTQFICNHPFTFVISEKNSNTILFVGKVVNP